MQTIIDTMEINANLGNIKDIGVISTDNYTYLKQVRTDVVKGKMTIALSINRRGGHYRMLTTLSEHEKEYKKALDELGIEVAKINRVDIAIDSEIDFKEEFKTLLYIFELLTYDDKKADRWYTTNLNTLEPNTIKSMGRSKDIVFYDKKEESEGRHLFSTRMEFRYKRLAIDTPEKQLEKVYKHINEIDVNVELVNRFMIERLVRLWNKEKGILKSFSEFVRKYNIYFYTAEILEGVYKETGLKGSYKNWINKYRKGNELKFISVSKVKQFQRESKKAINIYRKN